MDIEKGNIASTDIRRAISISTNKKQTEILKRALNEVEYLEQMVVKQHQIIEENLDIRGKVLEIAGATGWKGSKFKDALKILSSLVN